MIFDKNSIFAYFKVPFYLDYLFIFIKFVTVSNVSCITLFQIKFTFWGIFFAGHEPKWTYFQDFKMIFVSFLNENMYFFRWTWSPFHDEFIDLSCVKHPGQHWRGYNYSINIALNHWVDTQDQYFEYERYDNNFLIGSM